MKNLANILAALALCGGSAAGSVYAYRATQPVPAPISSPQLTQLDADIRAMAQQLANAAQAQSVMLQRIAESEAQIAGNVASARAQELADRQARAEQDAKMRRDAQTAIAERMRR